MKCACVLICIIFSSVLPSLAQRTKPSTYRSIKDSTFDIGTVNVLLPGHWTETSSPQGKDSESRAICRWHFQDSVSITIVDGISAPTGTGEIQTNYLVTGRTLMIGTGQEGNRYEILFVNEKLLLVRWYESWGLQLKKSRNRMPKKWNDVIVKTQRRDQIIMLEKLDDL